MYVSSCLFILWVLIFCAKQLLYDHLSAANGHQKGHIFISCVSPKMQMKSFDIIQHSCNTSDGTSKLATQVSADKFLYARMVPENVFLFAGRVWQIISFIIFSKVNQHFWRQQKLQKLLAILELFETMEINYVSKNNIYKKMFSAFVSKLEIAFFIKEYSRITISNSRVAKRQVPRYQRYLGRFKFNRKV